MNRRVSKGLPALILLSLIAGSQARAADEPREKQKTSSKAERAIENTGKQLGKTADRAEKSVKRGLGRAERAINTAGKKTGRWLNEKAK